MRADDVLEHLTSDSCVTSSVYDALGQPADYTRCGMAEGGDGDPPVVALGRPDAANLRAGSNL